MQNIIESWLYFVNVVIILLGGLYTLLNTATFQVGITPLSLVTLPFTLTPHPSPSPLNPRLGRRKRRGGCSP